MDATERVRKIVLPIVDRNNAVLYDIEHESGVLRIMVDRPGGIDIDTIGEITQQISHELDENDPLPGQRYLLEVTSPGVERKLRLPEHFSQQIGKEVNVKLRSSINGVRRLQSRLESVDENGIELLVEGAEGSTSQRISYDQIEQARSVFNWDEETKKETPNKKASSR